MLTRLFFIYSQVTLIIWKGWMSVAYFGHFYLDKEKDMIVELDMEGQELSYVLRTPNHATGNLITNLARLCHLPLDTDKDSLKIITGVLPCYVDANNRLLYVFRLLDTKIANIYPDGTIERKASIPAISKTLMSQTKDYLLDFRKTVVKTYILRECKFETDLHTHMNANLTPDILIALGIHHQIRYPLYYIRKLGLKCTPAQEALLAQRRSRSAEAFRDSPLRGKYLERKINDNTFLNFADLMTESPENAKWNIPRIRASLAILKDGQAVFTNLEKVYLYRYVFCKGVKSEDRSSYTPEMADRIPDEDIVRYLRQMADDLKNPSYAGNTLFQDKLLWIARSYARCGIHYVEISDTTLVKKEAAASMLRQVHQVMPAIFAETGVLIRFLAAIRRTPLTILKDHIDRDDSFRENLQVLRAVAEDPYVAGSDIIGEEINDIRDLTPILHEITSIARDIPTFTIRVHAGENDSLRDNVANTLKCIRDSLSPGQPMPHLRIGHGLYTANLRTIKGRQLVADLRNAGAVLEFQITSNVRLNNLSSMGNHPLRQYLHAGVKCVQGTDGGALYGTDSIDEELSLEKMLNLTHDDLMHMHSTELEVMHSGIAAFHSKMDVFRARLASQSVQDYYERAIRDQALNASSLLVLPRLQDSQEVFAGQIHELPIDRVPVILVGGSFNNDRHLTRCHPDVCQQIRDILDSADPEKMFFVIGHSMSGYEQFLVSQDRGRHDIYAFVPSKISGTDAKRLKQTDVSVRVSIEPSPMAIYKSISYEIFKRRPSVLIALDGNSSAGNMIQEAKNGKGGCHIYVLSRAKMLREKALSLQGYVTLFSPSYALSSPLQEIIDSDFHLSWFREDASV